VSTILPFSDVHSIDERQAPKRQVGSFGVLMVEGKDM